MSRLTTVSISAMRRFTASFTRNFSSRSNDSLTWLVKEKGVSPDVASGVLKAFGGAPTVSELKQLGNAGLVAYVDAVSRDFTTTRHDKANVIVHFESLLDKSKFTKVAKVGDSLCDLCKHEDQLLQYLECACGGIAACSTCHVIVDPEHYELLKEPEEAELDMIDLAWGTAKTSRLGCQMQLIKACDGIKISIPAEFNNLH